MVCFCVGFKVSLVADPYRLVTNLSSLVADPCRLVADLDLFGADLDLFGGTLRESSRFLEDV
jgi:hypothetical protein